MTDLRDRPKATNRWRAVIHALEKVVLLAPEESAIDPAEAEEVRRLVMVRTAPWRRDALPAAWTRRPGFFLREVVPDTEPAPHAAGAEKPRPPSPERPASAPRPWRE
jgi:hypothetical protein